MKKSKAMTDNEVTAAQSEKTRLSWSSMNKKKRVITVCVSALLLLTLAAAIVLPIVLLSEKDANFDYLNADLSKYVSFSEEDYKNYTLDIDIAAPKDIDPDVAMLNMLASDAAEEPSFDGALKKNVAVTPGDVVYIWYRGYLLDEEGEELLVSGMCNYGNTSPTTLTIGSGSFVPGFELGLLGKLPQSGSSSFKITSGTVTEQQIAYVSYSLLEDGKASDSATKGKTVRVVMSSENVDKDMGEGFKNVVLGSEIGQKMDFDVKKSGKTYHYTDFTVDFVTEKEADSYTIECYFPYDYSSTTLANETAYFEVTIVNTQVYEVPEYSYAPDENGKYRFNLTNDYVARKVAEAESPITLEELNEYEGEELWQKYRAYAVDYLQKAYEENLKAMVEEEMWNYYLEKATILKYPENKVSKIYREYYDDVLYQYEYTAGGVTDYFDEDGDGEYDDIIYRDNIDDFAVDYLGIYYYEETWQEVLRGLAEDLVAERLILYYIMVKEDLVPSEEVFEAKLAAIKQEYIDEYLLQYAEEFEEDLSKFTEEEYAAYVAEREAELFEYYDEEYFRETTYYEIALETFVTYPTVTTMDGRASNLPQKK